MTLRRGGLRFADRRDFKTRRRVFWSPLPSVWVKFTNESDLGRLLEASLETSAEMSDASISMISCKALVVGLLSARLLELSLIFLGVSSMSMEWEDVPSNVSER